MEEKQKQIEKPKPVEKPKTSISIESLSGTINIQSPDERKETALHRAIRKGNLPLTVDLSQTKSINLEIQDFKGRTPLHLAAFQPSSGYVNALVGEGKAKVNAVDHLGETPLHKAAKVANNIEVVTALVKNGANLDAQSGEAETPLHVAILSPDTNLEKIGLLSSAKNLFIQANPLPHLYHKEGPVEKRLPAKSTPLHYAFYRKEFKPDLILPLCAGKEKTENLNIANENGEIPLYLAMQHFAINKVDEHTLQHLLDHSNKALTTTDKSTVLHAASKNQYMSKETYEKSLTVFLQSYILNSTDQAGNTALYYTLLHKQEDKAHLLLNNNANANMYKGNSPLHLACQHNLTKLALRLIDVTSDLNARDTKGNTPFQTAVKNSNSDILIVLLKHKINITPDLLKWAVHEALLNNARDTLLVLVRDYGADPNIHVSLPKAPARSLLSSPSSSLGSNAGDLERFTTRWLEEGDTVLHYAVKQCDDELAAACLKINPEVLHSVNAPRIKNQSGTKDNTSQTTPKKEKKESKPGRTPAQVALSLLKGPKRDSKVPYLLYVSGARENTPQNSSFFAPSAIFTPAENFNTLLMKSGSRGIHSKENLVDFFANPNYQLNKEQEDMQDKITIGYRAP